MSKEERAQRLALMLFFSVVVFIALVVTLILTVTIVYIFSEMDLLLARDGSNMSLTRVLLLMAGLSLVIGTALTFVIIRIPLNPINELLNGMKRLAQGDYAARIGTDGIFSRHHTGFELIASFNRLASELESTEMLRSDFINNFSHEFKTPIVSISGFAKLLKRGNLSGEQREACLDAIEYESLRLANMATNVLNLTKVENQAILTGLTQYNLSEQLRTCMLMLESKWDSKRIQLGLEFDEHMIYANMELMSQVWTNLIDNAIKFSPEGGTVSIAVEDTGSLMKVSVSNEGEAIPPESRAKIFNKFYQCDESHTTEGNGIGLAIVRRIVSLHEGSVQVESQDGLNTFTVSLPKKQAIQGS